MGTVTEVKEFRKRKDLGLVVSRRKSSGSPAGRPVLAKQIWICKCGQENKGCMEVDVGSVKKDSWVD